MIETEKLNVITLYSSAEAIEPLRPIQPSLARFLDASMRDMPYTDLCSAFGQVVPDPQFVLVGGHCDGHGIHVDRFYTQALCVR